MNHRRTLMVALGAGTLIAPFTSIAQQPGTRPGEKAGATA